MRFRYNLDDVSNIYPFNTFICPVFNSKLYVKSQDTYS